MPVKIRLQRRGRKKKPFYHIVVADVRAPRDGKFIEKLGIYNPMTSPATIEIDRERAYEWLKNGAQPTDTARAILRFKGVLYLKHLKRGVAKGAFSEEEADKLFAEWLADKETRVKARIEESTKKEQDKKRAIATEKSKQIPIEDTVEEASTEAPVEKASTETPAEETTSKAPAEEVTSEAPVSEKATSETPAVEEPSPEAPEAKATETSEEPTVAEESTEANAEEKVEESTSEEE
ncbi:MAG: 30S ribosomal protein S16 [Bacteroidia bacterium]|nr:30S ribosomal protein S16 [Bacteroidia bacterium]